MAKQIAINQATFGEAKWIIPDGAMPELYPPSFDLPEETVETGCKHEWVWYQSLMGRNGDFEYCQDCGARKDEA